jgi:hypothetical protein
MKGADCEITHHKTVAPVDFSICVFLRLFGLYATGQSRHNTARLREAESADSIDIRLIRLTKWVSIRKRRMVKEDHYSKEC